MIEISQIIDKSPVSALGIVYLAGVATSLTPCIYPLIPIMVGVIGSRRAGKLKGFFLSLLYVLGMAVTYAVLGTVSAVGGMVFGLTAHSWWVNFLVGGVLLFFGLIMLDLINMPLFTALNRRLQAGISGTGSIFIMGLISGLVAAPCSTPVLGSILTFVAVSRNIVMGMLLLFIYGFGTGTILIVAGTFAGLAAAMPKSGKWMVIVKKFFGLVIIIIALYFIWMGTKALMV
ncbi:MAG: cytochrome c biogenesis protein CcdA [Elusimicrobiota bacterium]